MCEEVHAVCSRKEALNAHPKPSFTLEVAAYKLENFI